MRNEFLSASLLPVTLLSFYFHLSSFPFSVHHDLFPSFHFPHVTSSLHVIPLSSLFPHLLVISRGLILI